MELKLLKDINGDLIKDGDTIKKVINIDSGKLNGGVVKWHEGEGVFKCGKCILYGEYMCDFVIIKQSKK